VSVSEEEIFGGVKEWASKEGVFASPEGAACLPAYQRLLREGFLKPSDKVVLFNTGSGLKYIDVIASALKIGV
jgi:threonine synthase